MDKQLSVIVNAVDRASAQLRSIASAVAILGDRAATADGKSRSLFARMAGVGGAALTRVDSRAALDAAMQGWWPEAATRSVWVKVTTPGAAATVRLTR